MCPVDAIKMGDDGLECQKEINQPQLKELKGASPPTVSRGVNFNEGILLGPPKKSWAARGFVGARAKSAPPPKHRSSPLPPSVLLRTSDGLLHPLTTLTSQYHVSHMSFDFFVFLSLKPCVLVNITPRCKTI